MSFTVRVETPPSGFVTVNVVLIEFVPLRALAVTGTVREVAEFRTTVPTVSRLELDVTTTPVSKFVPESVSVEVLPARAAALGVALNVPGPATTIIPVELVPVPPLGLVTVTKLFAVVVDASDVALTFATIEVEVTDTTVAERPELDPKDTVAPVKKPDPGIVTRTSDAPCPTPPVVPGYTNPVPTVRAVPATIVKAGDVVTPVCVKVIVTLLALTLALRVTVAEVALVTVAAIVGDPVTPVNTASVVPVVVKPVPVKVKVVPLPAPIPKTDGETEVITGPAMVNALVRGLLLV